MTQTLAARPASEIVYPESDGKRLAENTQQFRWITILAGNLAALFRDREDVFVSGDQLWYPVEGFPEIRQAPDVYVVFGRPKGDRRSWKQWEENNVPMTVVFEILSPGNTLMEMADKFAFYEEYGVEEYYIYDPDHNSFRAFTRGQAALRRTWQVDNFVSSRLGIRFQLTQPEMTVFGPDGTPFRSFEDTMALLDRERQERLDAQRQRDDAQRQRDDAQRQRDDALKLATRLAELGRKARRGQASEDELRELERLEEQSGI